MTSSLDFGVKVIGKGQEKPHPVHANDNDDIIRFLNHGFSIDRMTVSKHYADHFSGMRTYYFTGNSQSKVTQTLLNIDIDCHKSGTLDGAKAFAQWIVDNLFPSMYWEVSTNGNGVHGYIIIEKEGLSADVLNDLFKRLERNLRHHLKEQGFDVEDVEVKGTLPIIGWHPTERGRAVTFTSGMLAKLPRQAERFEELQATTVVSATTLLKMPVLSETKKARVRVVSSSSVSSMSSSSSGSVSGRVIDEDEVRNISGRYLELGEALVGRDGLKLAHRVKATAEDVAVFICLLKFFTLNPNPDGSLPWERGRQLWTALYDAQQTTRQFSPQRWAAIRDLLDSFGLIHWTNKEYRLPTVADGKTVKGEAAKWCGSDLFLKLVLDQAQTGLNEGVVKGERGESILSVNTVFTVDSLTQKPRSEITRPVPTYGPDIKYRLPDPETLVPCYRLAA